MEFDDFFFHTLPSQTHLNIVRIIQDQLDVPIINVNNKTGLLKADFNSIAFNYNKLNLCSLVPSSWRWKLTNEREPKRDSYSSLI